MSKIAKEPVELPQGVELSRNGTTVAIKGVKGLLSMELNSEIELIQEEKLLTVKPRSGSRFATAMSGTTRALLANMVQGVTDGFEKKLELVGIGYRANCEGNKLNMTLGFSHPVTFNVPEGITIETPNATTVIIKGINKQEVGQVAANIRELRKPEPYKGKGIKEQGQYILRKEGKKK